MNRMFKVDPDSFFFVLDGAAGGSVVETSSLEPFCLGDFDGLDVPGFHMNN